MRNPRHFAAAAVAYLLPTFPLGYLWLLNWFHAHYEQLQMYRADVIIPMGLGSMLIQAAIYAALYPRMFAGQSWVRGALSFGLTFGTLAWSLPCFRWLPSTAWHRWRTSWRWRAPSLSCSTSWCRRSLHWHGAA